MLLNVPEISANNRMYWVQGGQNVNMASHIYVETRLKDGVLPPRLLSNFTACTVKTVFIKEI
jgi:hypothetical protein